MCVVLALLLAGPEPHREEAFSKIKHLPVRKVGARGREALVEAIGLALAARHDRGCGKLVRPRRLLAAGSTLMSTAVSIRDSAFATQQGEQRS